MRQESKAVEATVKELEAQRQRFHSRVGEIFGRLREIEGELRTVWTHQEREALKNEAQALRDDLRSLPDRMGELVWQLITKDLAPLSEKAIKLKGDLDKKLAEVEVYRPRYNELETRLDELKRSLPSQLQDSPEVVRLREELLSYELRSGMRKADDEAYVIWSQMEELAAEANARYGKGVNLFDSESFLQIAVERACREHDSVAHAIDLYESGKI